MSTELQILFLFIILVSLFKMVDLTSFLSKNGYSITSENFHKLIENEADFCEKHSSENERIMDQRHSKQVRYFIY